MKKTKILYIVEAMGGGVYTYILELANELVDSFDFYIAYAVRPQTPEDYREQFDSRIHLIEVKNFARAISLVKDVKAFFEIRKIADDVQPNLIHLHSSKAGALGRWAFNGKKIPLFYTPHGYSFLMQNHSIVKRMTYKFIEVVSGKRQCMTISCSEGEHQESLKITPNATYVDNGVNIRELQGLMDRTPEKGHPFTVFTLGRICYQKNPKMFNEVAEALPDIRFLWIGDGKLRDELKSPNIEITGWVERSDAIRYSMCTDVFVLTSLWEGLPMSLLEAMYMKKVCVVSDVIGNRDVIKNNKNGFVCKEVSDFVEAINEARQSGCGGLVDNAYKDSLLHYNTNVMAGKYARIYDEALTEKGEFHVS